MEDRCTITHQHPEAVERARRSLPGELELLELADRFQALSDPSRLRMLMALTTGELCVCDLASVAGLSPSATSHHLRYLRKARLVRARRHGNVVYYRLACPILRGLLEKARECAQNELEVTRVGK